MSDSAPHRLQHSRVSCPSRTPGVHPNSSHASVMPSSHLVLCRLLLFPPSVFPSVRVFCSASVLHHQVAKVLEFQLQPPDVFLELSCCSHDPADVGNLISGSSAFSKTSLNISEYSGLISFRMDWLDLLAVQGTLKSLLQHRGSKASILWCSAFCIVQLLHPYMTTGKTIALTRWALVGKVMSLLFNMLSRLVITFLPRSKRLLISWLQSPSAVILESPSKK